MIADDAQTTEDRRRRRIHRPARAFTLLEILVSIAIITVLLSLLFPAISSAVALARSQKCQAGQRSVGFDFSIFGDEALHGYRGSDATSSLFSLTSFQDAQYQVGEFWAWGNVDEATLAAENGPDPLRCPEVVGPVTLTRGRQAFEGGVGPAQSLSFGFNIRLHVVETIDSGGRPRAQRTRLSGSVLEKSNVPLMWDIDPAVATAHNTTPLLSGPSLGSTGVFAGDRYWFPGLRHRGKANFAFIDGHVAESGRPLQEQGWDWGYSPPVR